MTNTKPYSTTTDLIDSIKRRISFPLSQNTFMYNDVVAFLNEELQLNAVPTVKEEHEEYFVYRVIVPLVGGINRYSIPDRAIGMALRDLKYIDGSGNLCDMTRISPENSAYFQESFNSNQAIGKYYLEGNEVVLAQQMGAGATGSLLFCIFLRPNYLVRDDRAAIIQNFQKPITVTNNSNVIAGDTITITTGLQTPNPSIVVITAVTGSPSIGQFQIGVDENTTAVNIANAIANLDLEDVTVSMLSSTATVAYEDIATSIQAVSSGISVDNKYIYINFNQLSSSYTDPDTDETSTLFSANAKVDFLQTNPGHRTYTYDVKLRSLDGSVGKFKISDLQSYQNSTLNGQMNFHTIKVGDYVCLANECIIPQIPPELHNALAERGASRILSAIGDKEGYAMSQAKIAEMDKKQGTLIGSRVEGSVHKVMNRNSLLRLGKRSPRRI